MFFLKNRVLRVRNQVKTEDHRNPSCGFRTRRDVRIDVMSAPGINALHGISSMG